MARERKPKQYFQVPAAVKPETIESLRQIAEEHEWSLSQVVRKAIEKGLETMLSECGQKSNGAIARDPQNGDAGYFAVQR